MRIYHKHPEESYLSILFKILFIYIFEWLFLWWNIFYFVIFSWWNTNLYHFPIFYRFSSIDGPEIEQNSTEYEQCKGTNARIVCSAVGQPFPDVLLQLNNNILIRNSSSLTYDFKLDTDAKFGSYVCVSNNTVGTVNVTTIIKSKRKLIIKSIFFII